MNDPILITGGTGFIGKHVLNSISQVGSPVYLLKNHTQLDLNFKNVNQIQCDLLSATKKEIFQLCSDYKIKNLIHLAWYTNHEDYLSSDKNTDWLEASKKLIDGFYEAKGEKCLALGTCLEHYYDSILPVSKENNLNGNTNYVNSKIQLSRYLKQVATSFKKDFVWARVFFVYGPYDRPNRLLHYIFKNLSQDKKVSPKFGGLIRDYIYAADLGDQIKNIFYNNFNGILDLGTGRQTKIQEIFDVAGLVLGKTHLIESNKVLTETQPASIVADLKSYREATIERGITPLSKGIKQTMDWFSENG